MPFAISNQLQKNANDMGNTSGIKEINAGVYFAEKCRIMETKKIAAIKNRQTSAYFQL